MLPKNMDNSGGMKLNLDDHKILYMKVNIFIFNPHFLFSDMYEEKYLKLKR
jgi:hypothetical protein